MRKYIYMKLYCKLGRAILFGATLVLSACSTPQPHPVIQNRGLSTFVKSFGDAGPGCAYAIRKQGVLLAEDANGLKNIGSKARLTASSFFDIGSVSKSFTAAVILDLEAAGALSLNDPLSKYISGLPTWGGRVTIADAMYMRSGVSEFRFDSPDVPGWEADRLYGTDLSPRDIVSADQIIDAIKTMADLNFEPGSSYEYSNSNYLLLRRVAESSSGSAFEMLVKNAAKRIGGIDIRISDFREGRRQSRSDVTGYDLGASETSVPLLSDWDVLGASSIWTSVRDLASWGEGLMLDSDRFEKHARIGIERNSEDEEHRGYGAGLMTIHINNERIVYHLGGTEGFSSGVFLRPERSEVLAFSCNMSPDLFFFRGLAGASREQLAAHKELVFLKLWLSDS